jgi:hypothetical protein
MNAADLRARTLAVIRRHPAPTHRQFRARAILLIAGSTAVSLAIFFLAGGLRLEPRPGSLLVATMGGAFAIAVLSILIGIRRGRSMLPRSGWQLALLVASVPVALFLWKIAWSAHAPGMMVEWPHRPGLRCFLLTLALGTAPLASLVVLHRNSEPLRPGLVGAALGTVIGAMAWGLLELWCPVGDPRHLLIGHVAPALLLAMIGAFLGRGILAIGDRRSRRRA